MIRRHNNMLENIIKKFDMFGLTFNFELEKQSNIKSFSGGILSIFFYIITIALFFGFGVDLYKRKNPKVSFNSKITNYEEVILSNNNFTLAFRVEDSQGIQIKNKSLLYQEVGFYSFEINDKGKWQNILRIDDQENNFKQCSEIDGFKEKEKFYNISLSSWYCLNLNNLKFGGYWDGNFVNGIIINTIYCSSEIEKNKQCVKEENIKDLFYDKITGSNYFYSFLYMESSPVMDNFSHPIQSYLVNKYEMLNLKLLKRSVQMFKKISIDNDIGWLFSDRQMETYLTNDFIFNDFILKDNDQQNVLYSHLIYLGKKNDLYSRTYTKLQEVFASVGGFSKLFLTMLSLLHFYIAQISKYFLILERMDFIFEKGDGNGDNYLKNNYFRGDIKENFFQSSDKNNKRFYYNKIKPKKNFSIEMLNDNNDNSNHFEKHHFINLDNKNCNIKENLNFNSDKINNDVKPKDSKRLHYKIQNKNIQRFKSKNEINFILDEKILRGRTQNVKLNYEINNLSPKELKNKNLLNNYIKERKKTEEPSGKIFGTNLNNFEEKNRIKFVNEDESKYYEMNNISNFENSEFQIKHDIAHYGTKSENFNNIETKKNIYFYKINDYKQRIINLSLGDFLMRKFCSFCKIKRLKKNPKNSIESFNHYNKSENIINKDRVNSKELKKIKKQIKKDILQNETNKGIFSETNEKKIYENFKIYKLNIEKFFDIFNYINLIKDVRIIKEILFKENDYLLEYVKPKLINYFDNKSYCLTKQKIDELLVESTAKDKLFSMQNLSIILNKQFSTQ